MPETELDDYALCAGGGGPVCRGRASLGQSADSSAGPIAIVPLDNSKNASGATVTGALEVSGDKAVIAASGTVASGTRTTEVVLPRRGILRVCASTSVKLAADNGVQKGEAPGLTMALDHGALEASFATGQECDIALTPDFRIVIGGPGAGGSEDPFGRTWRHMRDNAGVNAAYVLVSSVFEGGAYRVQAGQRVMFQNGSLHEVVDQEKEPCGCPSEAAQGNEFPLAQSEGLGPGAPPVANLAATPTAESLSVSGKPKSGESESTAQPAAAASAEQKPAETKKPGFFSRLGRFFRRVFGAE